MDNKKAIIIMPIFNFIIFYCLITKLIDISIYDAIGYAIITTLIELILFKKCLWKIKFIQQITGITNIQGIWIGKIISSFDNKEHTIDKVIIKQSFDKYKIVMETEESKSYSDISQIKINEFERMELQYMYKNEVPVNLRKKNPMHFGVANLEYKNNKLVGSYWTDREIGNGKNTRGTMELEKISNKGNYDLITLFDFFELF